MFLAKIEQIRELYNSVAIRHCEMSSQESMYTQTARKIKLKILIKKQLNP